MADDETQLHIEYPVNDNFLQIKIPEDSRGAEERVIQETIVRLNTYEAQHTLDADFSFKDVGVAAQFFGRVHHFKKALKEFNFL